MVQDVQRPVSYFELLNTDKEWRLYLGEVLNSKYQKLIMGFDIPQEEYSNNQIYTLLGNGSS